MGTADIEAAIKSTTEKKKDLRKAFEAFQSQSSALVSFTLQWKDIEDHFSSIEKSIEERFRELKELDISSKVKKAAPTPPAPSVVVKKEEPDVYPRAELKAFCVQMDGKGLISFIIENRKDIAAIRSELGRALLYAPNPITLVLDSLNGFIPGRKIKGELRVMRNTCLTLLECLHGLDLQIEPSATERAREMAEEWKELITDGKEKIINGDDVLVVLGVLHLVATFGLIESFDVDDVLNLVVLVSRRKNIVDLYKKLALDDNIPDLITKLNNNGKQLDAIKFVIAYDLTDKYPPTSFLKAHIKESKKAAQELRRKGNDSAKSKNVANYNEITAFKAAIQTVKEFKLESEFNTEYLQKRIDQLENQRSEKKPEKKPEIKPEKKPEMKPEKKRGATAITPSTSNGMSLKQQHEQPNKRSRPFASSAPHNPTPLSQLGQHSQLSQLGQHSQLSQLSLIDRAPYSGLTTEAPSLYGRGNASLYNYSIGVGGSSASLMLPSKPPKSSASSAYYDRVVLNDSFSNFGLPASYYSNRYL